VGPPTPASRLTRCPPLPQQVWSISQHPNYAGNLLVWTGITALNAPALLSPAGGMGAGLLRLAVGCASPLFMVALLYGQASGAMSNTVELAQARYGSDPRYQQYVRGTPLIMPSPRSIGQALRKLPGAGDKPEL
jgi:steroid 5-alpha reductase family enzyme